MLAGVSLKAYSGQRLGIVGENGAGKSTLLGLPTGTEEADSGEVVRTDDVGFLHQESPFPENGSVAEVVEAALAEARGTEQRLAELARQLERRPEDTEALAAYGEALGEAEARGVWDADRRAEMVLAGLGLESISKDRALASLSGGERSRLALAALLMRRPRALLLDEPTNHLDDEALAFLEEHLRGVSGVVVVASHDRVFLDAVCTGILDLDPARGGNWAVPLVAEPRSTGAPTRTTCAPSAPSGSAGSRSGGSSRPRSPASRPPCPRPPARSPTRGR